MQLFPAKIFDWVNTKEFNLDSYSNDSWCVNPPQTDSFRKSLSHSPKNLWKLSVDGTSPYQEIRRSS